MASGSLALMAQGLAALAMAVASGLTLP